MLGFDEREGVPPLESFWIVFIRRIWPGMVGSSRRRPLQNRTDFNHSYRVILPSGEVRDIQGIGHPVFNSSGELVKFQAV